MDVYTTSFCLPHRAAQVELEDHSSSFELPRDVAAAAAANNHPRHHNHQNQQQQQQLAPQTHPRHQVNRSLSSYSRPASIPEDREDGLNALGESTSSSSTGGGSSSRISGGLTSSQTSAHFGEASSSNGSNGAASTILGSGGSNSGVMPITSTGGLLPRRSTSSIASLGQQTGTTTTTTAASSTAGDAASTAPSSQIGHGGMTSFPTSSTGVASVPSLKHIGNTGNMATGANYTDSASSAENAAAIQRANAELAEAMQKLCMEAMSNFQCMVTCSPVEGPPSLSSSSSFTQAQTQGAGPSSQTRKVTSYNFILSGGYPQVMGARGYILRSTPFNKKSIVKVPRTEVLNGGGKDDESVKVEMKKKLDEIASITRAHLAIVGQVSGQIGFGLEIERNVEIVITGSYESVEQARVRLLVLLDELAGLHSDVCEIDYKLHNIISGRKRHVIQTIQEETATNIYFPTPLTGIISPRDPALLSKQNLIFITGEFFGVQRARDMLFQVSMHKSKCIISRDTAMLPRKLDWLLSSDKLDQVKNIMFDNGTFINFPMIGSQASLISVYGDHRVNIERTLRAIMNLATQFYVSQFWLLPMNFDVFMPPPTINPSQVPAILKLISATTGAEAVFKSNCFEYHGTENEVRTAVQLVLELELVKAFHHEIRFQIELGNEHRDFISGKKNGKLNKIMKTAGVKIKFETFNDYNFLIDIAGNDTGALHGLSLLQEELPAEISFHVPEIYHKRIIGVGGKNIQRIMKKYGVYVKFSNAEEFVSLGGYHENEDNVIARTPAKNNASLDQLKAAVMEMVIPKDKDYVVETVSIPRRYHRTLLGEKSIFIHDIESKTNSIVRFPNKETAADVVSIFGPESQVHIAAQMLLDHVPFEAEYRMPHSEQMSQLALAQEFIELQERIKRDLNITILPWVDRSGAGEETVIRFLLNRSNQHFLTTARDTVEEFLLAQSIPLYPSSLRPRSDSFATSFPFFNSKLLSTLGDNDSTTQSPRNNTSTLPDDRERPVLRPAVSSPDIKALFNAPQGHQAYNYMQSETNSRNTNASVSGQSPAYHHQPLYQPKAASPGLPDLHTPQYYARQAAPGSGHTPSYSTSSSFLPSHPTRLSDQLTMPPAGNSKTSSKRESDPVMDDKLKDMIRRGTIGHHMNARAQSLDISQQTKTFGRHASPADSEAVSAALSQLRL